MFEVPVAFCINILNLSGSLRTTSLTFENFAWRSHCSMLFVRISGQTVNFTSHDINCFFYNRDGECLLRRTH